MYLLTYIHAYVEIFAWFFTIVCERMWVFVSVHKRESTHARMCIAVLYAWCCTGVLKYLRVTHTHTHTLSLSLSHTYTTHNTQTQCTYIHSDLAGFFRTTFRSFWKAPFSFPLPFPNHRTPTSTLGLRSSATSVRADTSLDCINIHVNTHLLLHVNSHEARTTHR